MGKPHQETFLLLKPDGTNKQLLVELLLRLRVNRLKVLQLKTVRLRASDVQCLYGQYRKEHFYARNKKFLMSGPCVAIHVKGPDAVECVRRIIGTGSPPYPRRSFRGQHATAMPRNVVHASDSEESAEKEINYFF